MRFVSNSVHTKIGMRISLRKRREWKVSAHRTCRSE